MQCILPEDDGQVCSHHIFSCPSGPGSGCIDGQLASRVLLRLVFVDVGDLEVGRPLDGPETLSERGNSARILLQMFMSSVLGRGVGSVTEPPKVLAPPTVVRVLRTLDNPIDALNHSTSSVTVSSSFRPRALHPSRRYYITSEERISGSKLQ